MLPSLVLSADASGEAWLRHPYSALVAARFLDVPLHIEAFLGSADPQHLYLVGSDAFRSLIMLPSMSVDQAV